MKVRELITLLDAKLLTDTQELDAEIACGYSCDLLSWVLAHGQEGMAWATVQTHVNVIAVAVLMGMACVILTEGVDAEAASLERANKEGLPVLSTRKTAYEACGLMAGAGVQPPKA